MHVMHFKHLAEGSLLPVPPNGFPSLPVYKDLQPPTLVSPAPQKATAEAFLQWEMVSWWETLYMFLLKPQSRLSLIKAVKRADECVQVFVYVSVYMSV